MTMADISNGPEWVGYGVGILLLVLSLVLLFGKGSWLIAGYNTSSKEEKKKYNERKLCKVTGGGLLVVSILVFFTSIFEQQLPSWFSYVIIGIIIVDTVVILSLSNTICKK